MRVRHCLCSQVRARFVNMMNDTTEFLFRRAAAHLTQPGHEDDEDTASRFSLPPIPGTLPFLGPIFTCPNYHLRRGGNHHVSWLHCILTRTTPCGMFQPNSNACVEPHPRPPQGFLYEPATEATEGQDNVLPDGSGNSSGSGDDSIAQPGPVDVVTVDEVLDEPLDKNRVLCERLVDKSRLPSGVDCSTYFSAPSPRTSSTKTSPRAPSSTTFPATHQGSRPPSSNTSSNLVLTIIIIVFAGVAFVILVIGSVGLCSMYRLRHKRPVKPIKRGTESEEQTVNGDELAMSTPVYLSEAYRIPPRTTHY